MSMALGWTVTVYATDELWARPLDRSWRISASLDQMPEGSSSITFGHD